MNQDIPEKEEATEEKKRNVIFHSFQKKEKNKRIENNNKRVINKEEDVNFPSFSFTFIGGVKAQNHRFIKIKDPYLLIGQNDDFDFDPLTPRTA